MRKILSSLVEEMVLELLTLSPKPNRESYSSLINFVLSTPVLNLEMIMCFIPVSPSTPNWPLEICSQIILFEVFRLGATIFT